MTSSTNPPGTRAGTVPGPARARAYGPAVVTLAKRAEFLRLRGGIKWSGPAFLVEGKPRLAVVPGRPVCAPPPPSGARFGFTITKKIGKAHERNRMRRRLKHALRLVEIPAALHDWDCVVVVRPSALDRPFDDLVRDFKQALNRLAAPRAAPRDRIAPRPPASGA